MEKDQLGSKNVNSPETGSEEAAASCDKNTPRKDLRPLGVTRERMKGTRDGRGDSGGEMS